MPTMDTAITIEPYFTRTGWDNESKTFKFANDLCQSSPMSPEYLAQLQLLLQENKNVARWECTEINCGYILLYTALKHDQPIEVIQLLVNAWQESVFYKDGFSIFALHMACHYSSHMDVIRFLMDRNPKALAAATFNGDLPIHYAARKIKQSQPILELLINAAPATLMKRRFENYTVLHCLLQYFIVNLELVQCIAERWGGALRTLNDKHETPLHMACEKQPAPVILYLLKKFKKAACMVDKNGQFPLHHLCKSNSSPIVLVARDLIEAFPHAVRHRDVNGSLPINSLPLFEAEGTSELIQYMVDMVPYSLLAQNNNGYLPIHMACLAQNEEMVVWMASRVPLSLTYENKYGKLPLHYLLSKDSPQVANELSIATMVQAFPPIISMGSFQFKPFDMAIRYGMTETGSIMANSYPRAIQMVVTDTGRNALHYACIRGYTDMILQLVVLCPAAAANTDDYNYLPLHYACEHHPLLPQHVIQNLVLAYTLACCKSCPRIKFHGYNYEADSD